jgi:hypothetical protein
VDINLKVEVEANNHPFAVSPKSAWIHCDVESRLALVRTFNKEQCNAALALTDMQKTVRVACERRLRKLEKNS